MGGPRSSGSSTPARAGGGRFAAVNRGVPNESVVQVVEDDLGLTRGEVQIMSREDVGPLASLLSIPDSVEEVLVQFEVDRQGNDSVLVGGRGPGGREWTIYYDTATIGL